jgi:phage terminase small subunit
MKVKVLDYEGKEIELTEEQKTFCELYAYSDIRGNGVRCYEQAFEVDLTLPSGYNTCKVNASKLLTSTNILSYIRALYSTTLNEETVDNELSFLISQNADFGAKLGAIKEFNNLKQRIIKKAEIRHPAHEKIKTRPPQE